MNYNIKEGKKIERIEKYYIEIKFLSSIKKRQVGSRLIRNSILKEAPFIKKIKVNKITKQGAGFQTTFQRRPFESPSLPLYITKEEKWKNFISLYSY